VLVRAAVSKDWKLVASDISAPVDGMELHIYSAQEEGRE
jgi:hypothetical protein